MVHTTTRHNKSTSLMEQDATLKWEAGFICGY